MEALSRATLGLEISEPFARYSPEDEYLEVEFIPSNVSKSVSLSIVTRHIKAMSEPYIKAMCLEISEPFARYSPYIPGEFSTRRRETSVSKSVSLSLVTRHGDTLLHTKAVERTLSRNQ